MKYQAGQRRKAVEYEKAITDWWKKNKTYEQSVEQRPADKSYVFYDGPPFITGNPHHGTLLSSIVKDAVPRLIRANGAGSAIPAATSSRIMTIFLTRPFRGIRTRQWICRQVKNS